jgi:serine phosphatase RsbU (regulator of sigma subunit)
LRIGISTDATLAAGAVRDNSAAFIEPYAAPPPGLPDVAEGWCRASMMPVGDGDQLLLYTDGVTEARDADGRFFPLAQVTADAVRGTGPDRAPLLDVLVAALDEHVGDRGCDDILLLLVTSVDAGSHHRGYLHP